MSLEKMKSPASSSSDVTISNSSNSHVKQQDTQTPNFPTQNQETDVGKVERGDVKEENETKEKSEAPAPPYSLFTINPYQKWMIVFLASIASFLSPVSGSIYLPVIPTIANVSASFVTVPPSSRSSTDVVLIFLRSRIS
jgi:hypothetical protein